ncbi:MAG: hypothetical protein JWN78_124 [Bacteroidota bacterium]|nr:hypothetical protein [Bacteroidota bacterium]
MNASCVYIITNYTRSVFYLGVTSCIWNRILEHKTGYGCTFSSKYNIKYLVYFEECECLEDALYREKQLKAWNREWKIELIKKENNAMEDLAKDWYTKEDINDFLESMKLY